MEAAASHESRCHRGGRLWSVELGGHSINPLADDTPVALLLFYGPMFTTWGSLVLPLQSALVALLTASRSEPLSRLRLSSFSHQPISSESICSLTPFVIEQTGKTWTTGSTTAALLASELS